MDFIQIMSCPADLVPIFKFLKNGIYPIIQIGIPILLIVMGSIDLGKAVMSSDDKEIKGATGKLIKRCIAAVAVFFVTTLVSFLMGLFDSTTDGKVETSTGDYNWADCWTKLP